MIYNLCLMNFARCIIALLALSFVCSAHAIMFDQIDTFEDGTTQNWTNGAPSAPPVINVVTGGPAGAGDHFIQVTSIGGNGPGSRLTAFNRDQWLGDYVGQGVTMIEMDLENLGKSALSIRIAFKADVSFGSPGYLSQPITLDPVLGWQHVVFDLSAATLIPIDGPDPINTFFAGNFSEMRIINAVGDSNMNGEPIAGQLGIDNIHAVPEPTSFVLAATGLLVVLAAKRSRKE